MLGILCYANAIDDMLIIGKHKPYMLAAYNGALEKAEMHLTKPRRFIRLSCMIAGPRVLSWRVKRGTAKHVSTQTTTPAVTSATTAIWGRMFRMVEPCGEPME